MSDDSRKKSKKKNKAKKGKSKDKDKDKESKVGTRRGTRANPGNGNVAQAFSILVFISIWWFFALSVLCPLVTPALCRLSFYLKQHLVWII